MYSVEIMNWFSFCVHYSFIIVADLQLEKIRRNNTTRGDNESEVWVVNNLQMDFQGNVLAAVHFALHVAIQ